MNKHDKQVVSIRRKEYKARFGKIPRNWRVYSINGIPNDNCPDNLILVPSYLFPHLVKLQKTHKKSFTKEQIEKVLLEIRPIAAKIATALIETIKKQKELRKLREDLGLVELTRAICL